MWSATWPTEVRALARDFFTTEVNDGQGYVHLNIGSTELQANHNISQNILVSRLLYQTHTNPHTHAHTQTHTHTRTYICREVRIVFFEL